MDARPEPGHSDLLAHGAKFSIKQWFKEHLVRALTHPAAQPGIGSFPLKGFGVREFQDSQHSKNTQAFIEAQRWEEQQIERGIQLVYLSTCQGNRAWMGPSQAVTEAKLFNSANSCFIGTEQVMIVLFQPFSPISPFSSISPSLTVIADVKASCQASGNLLLLKNHD